ncbi:hypothetical protein [Bartonella tribocorum]|uniref:hypothetical protein n=1 Tax=Bartonella tribocorum TaxID=85701 RepID=UPI0002EE7A3B|nr:hypothetical protein [Bartonella tribocorum]CDO49438.1 hypothetical protein BM1374166_01786 [Bartonella tribocorum]
MMYIIIASVTGENKFEKWSAVVYWLLAYKVSRIYAQKSTVFMGGMFYKTELESQALGQK